MNKEEFIKELSKKLNIKEEAKKINDILETNFIIGKKNKDKIINELKEKLNIDETKANKIYEASAILIKDGIKDKLKNPFKSLD